MTINIIDIALAASAIVWVACILICLSMQLHYSRVKDGFLKRLLITSAKMDYTSIADEMTTRDKRIYLASFVGIFVFFLPGAYFLGSLLHDYLNSI